MTPYLLFQYILAIGCGLAAAACVALVPIGLVLLARGALIEATKGPDGKRAD